MTTVAYGVSDFGGPEALREFLVQREVLGRDDVRIQVAFAAVNPADVLKRLGARAPSGRPPKTIEVPGMDVGGLVTEVGDSVRSLSVGDRVVAIVVPSGEHGGYRRDLVVPAASVIRAPRNVSMAAASTLPMNGLTALLALDVMGTAPRQSIAVTGAAGALGGYVIQLAKARGCVLIADAAPADEALIRKLGADHLVERGQGFAAAVRARFPEGVDALVDGALLGLEALPAVRDGGVVATVRGYTGEGTERVRVTPIRVYDVAHLTAWLEDLRDHVEAGELSLRVADLIAASDVAAAHRRLESGGVRGRIVLDFSEFRTDFVAGSDARQSGAYRDR